MATTDRTFKVVLGEDIRRITAPTAGADAYAAFASKVAGIFGDDELTFKWKDTDGDLITIANADDFAEALLSQPTGPIRLYAYEAGASRTASRTASTASSAVPTTPVTAEAPLEPEPEWVKIDGQQQIEPEPEPEPAATPVSADTPVAADAAPVPAAPLKAPEPAPAPTPAPAKPEPAVHHHVICDGSGEQPLTGTRYHKVDANYDLNEAEFAKLPESEKQHFEIVLHPGAPPVRYEPVIHFGIVCDGTNASPILGTRFHKIGADYDLSQPEFAKLAEEDKQLFELVVHPSRAPIPYKRPEDAAADDESSDVPHFVRMLQDAMTHGGVVDIDLTELVKNIHHRKPAQQRQHRGECRRGPCSGGRSNRRSNRQEIAVGEVLPAEAFGIGSFGPGVEQLQRFLIEHDLMDQAAIAWRAGLFGPWTRKAVAMFQKANEVAGAEADWGRFDAATRAALLTLAAAAPAPSPDADTAPASPDPDPAVQQQSQYQAEPAVPLPSPTAPAAETGKWSAELATLAAMGFDDAGGSLTTLLDRKQGSVAAVVSAMLGSR